jgi:hypothetical protein
MLTSPNQPDQPSRDNYEPLEDTRRPAGRSHRSRSKSSRPWIGLSAIALMGLTAVLISVATGGTHQAAPSGSSVPRAAPGRTNSTGGAVLNGTSTAKGKVISAAKLAENGGAISLPTSMQSSVASWQSGAGGRDLTAVSSRLGAALQAGDFRQYSSMKYACGQLASSVATATAGPPIPDAAMQKLYATALTELSKGAADCQTAISVKPEDTSVETRVDTALLNLSTSKLSVGATDVFRSTAEIEIVSRQREAK